MPKISYVDPIKYRKEYASDEIRKAMRQKNMKQNGLATLLGVSQSRVSQKLKDMEFDYGELLVLFDELEMDDKQKQKIMTI